MTPFEELNRDCHLCDGAGIHIEGEERHESYCDYCKGTGIEPTKLTTFAASSKFVTAYISTEDVYCEPIDAMNDAFEAGARWAQSTLKWSVVITPLRKLRMTIGNQSFDLDVQDDAEEPERMEWFRDMLTKALTRLTVTI